MEFKKSNSFVLYQDALQEMEERVEQIHNNEKDELLWLLEHPSIYTAGTSSKADDLLNPNFPVFETGRGGEHTYHGPGQRVGYVLLDLKKRFNAPDIKKFIWMLEEWIIKTLEIFEIKGERRDGRVGIWVVSDDKEEKIAAIGIRIRRWISFHGISINLNPDLSHFEGIVPCGIKEYGVTSFEKLGVNVSMQELDSALQKSFEQVFG